MNDYVDIIRRRQAQQQRPGRGEALASPRLEQSTAGEAFQGVERGDYAKIIRERQGGATERATDEIVNAGRKPDQAASDRGLAGQLNIVPGLVIDETRDGLTKEALQNRVRGVLTQAPRTAKALTNPTAAQIAADDFEELARLERAILNGPMHDELFKRAMETDDATERWNLLLGGQLLMEQPEMARVAPYTTFQRDMAMAERWGMHKWRQLQREPILMPAYDSPEDRRLRERARVVRRKWAEAIYFQDADPTVIQPLADELAMLQARLRPNPEWSDVLGRQVRNYIPGADGMERREQIAPGIQQGWIGTAASAFVGTIETDLRLVDEMFLSADAQVSDGDEAGAAVRAEYQAARGGDPEPRALNDMRTAAARWARDQGIEVQGRGASELLSSFTDEQRYEFAMWWLDGAGGESETMFGSAREREKVGEQLMDYYLTLEDEIEQVQGRRWTAQYLAGTMLQSFGDMIPGLALSVASGSPAPMTASIFATAYGRSFVDGQRKGLTAAQARDYALLNAAAEAIPEWSQVRLLLKSIGSSAHLGRKFAEQALTEAYQEGLLTQPAQDITENIFFPGSVTPAEMGENALEAAIVGVGVAGGMVTTTHPLQMAKDYARRRAIERMLDDHGGAAAASMHDQIKEGAAGSKTKARSPETFEEIVEEQIAGTGMESMYVPADAILQAAGVEPQLDDDASAIIQDKIDRVAQIDAQLAERSESQGGEGDSLGGRALREAEALQAERDDLQAQIDSYQSATQGEQTAPVQVFQNLTEAEAYFAETLGVSPQAFRQAVQNRQAVKVRTARYQAQLAAAQETGAEGANPAENQKANAIEQFFRENHSYRMDGQTLRDLSSGRMRAVRDEVAAAVDDSRGYADSLSGEARLVYQEIQQGLQKGESEEVSATSAAILTAHLNALSKEMGLPIRELSERALGDITFEKRYADRPPRYERPERPMTQAEWAREQGRMQREAELQKAEQRARATAEFDIANGLTTADEVKAAAEAIRDAMGYRASNAYKRRARELLAAQPAVQDVPLDAVPAEEQPVQAEEQAAEPTAAERVQLDYEDAVIAIRDLQEAETAPTVDVDGLAAQDGMIEDDGPSSTAALDDILGDTGGDLFTVVGIAPEELQKVQSTLGEDWWITAPGQIARDRLRLKSEPKPEEVKKAHRRLMMSRLDAVLIDKDGLVLQGADTVKAAEVYGLNTIAAHQALRTPEARNREFEKNGIRDALLAKLRAEGVPEAEAKKRANAAQRHAYKLHKARDSDYQANQFVDVKAANFARWFGGAHQLLTAGEGQPRLFFMGTTMNFDNPEFEVERSGLDNDLGPGVYITSHPVDASENYATTESVEFDIKLDNLVEERARQAGVPRLSDQGFEIERQAMAELAQNAGMMVPLYSNLKNPAILNRSGGTMLRGEDGSLDRFKDAVRSVIEENQWSAPRLQERLDRLTGDVSLAEAYSQLLADGRAYEPDPNGDRRGNHLGVTTREGRNASHAAFGQALRAMGFDGVIDQTVADKFGQSTPADAFHVIAFQPESVKSPFNRGTYQIGRRNFMEQLVRAPTREEMVVYDALSGAWRSDAATAQDFLGASDRGRHHRIGYRERQAIERLAGEGKVEVHKLGTREIYVALIDGIDMADVYGYTANMLRGVTGKHMVVVNNETDEPLSPAAILKGIEEGGRSIVADSIQTLHHPNGARLHLLEELGFETQGMIERTVDDDMDLAEQWTREGWSRENRPFAALMTWSGTDEAGAEATRTYLVEGRDGLVASEQAADDAATGAGILAHARASSANAGLGRGDGGADRGNATDSKAQQAEDFAAIARGIALADPELLSQYERTAKFIDMTAQGVGQRDAWAHTAVQVGYDGELELELSDEHMVLSDEAWRQTQSSKKKERTFMLGDVLRHDELFNSPGMDLLRFMPVRLKYDHMDNHGSGSMGASGMVAAGRTKEIVENTIAHELQHAVRHLEGRAGGTNPTMAKIALHRISKRQQRAFSLEAQEPDGIRVRQFVQEEFGFYPTLAQFQRIMAVGELVHLDPTWQNPHASMPAHVNRQKAEAWVFTHPDARALYARLRSHPALRGQVMQLVAQDASRVRLTGPAYAVYRRDTGEQAAYLADTSRKLTMAQRMASPPAERGMDDVFVYRTRENDRRTVVEDVARAFADEMSLAYSSLVMARERYRQADRQAVGGAVDYLRTEALADAMEIIVRDMRTTDDAGRLLEAGQELEAYNPALVEDFLQNWRAVWRAVARAGVRQTPTMTNGRPDESAALDGRAIDPDLAVEALDTAIALLEPMHHTAQDLARTEQAVFLDFAPQWINRAREKRLEVKGVSVYQAAARPVAIKPGGLRFHDGANMSPTSPYKAIIGAASKVAARHLNAGQPLANMGGEVGEVYLHRDALGKIKDVRRGAHHLFAWPQIREVLEAAVQRGPFVDDYHVRFDRGEFEPNENVTQAKIDQKRRQGVMGVWRFGVVIEIDGESRAVEAIIQKRKDRTSGQTRNYLYGLTVPSRNVEASLLSPASGQGQGAPTGSASSARPNADKPKLSMPGKKGSVEQRTTAWWDEQRRWFRNSKVVDQSGKPQMMFRGDWKGGKLGDAFRVVDEEDGGSGAIYWTDNPEIASNYSLNKPFFEEAFDNVIDNSTVSLNGKTMLLAEAGRKLRAKQRQAIEEAVLSVGERDDGTGIGAEEDERVIGGYTWREYLQRAGGDYVRAADDVLLGSGTMDVEEYIRFWNEVGVFDRFFWDDPTEPNSLVTPAYLRIENPLDVYNVSDATLDKLEAIVGADDFTLEQLRSNIAMDGPRTVTLVTKAFREAAQQLGFDGIKDIGGRITGESDHTVWLAFSGEQVKSVMNAGRFAEGGTIVEQRGTRTRGVTDFEFDEQGMLRRAVMRLTEERNLSTFLHEGGHIMLEMLRWAAAQPEATPRIRRDFDLVKQYLGITDESVFTTFTKGPNGETVWAMNEFHEKFARALELYLMEGRAPTEELQDTFSRISVWLNQIYRIAAEVWAYFGGQKLTENEVDMREIFDRLLATEEEVAAARERMGLVPLFRNAAEAEGMGADAKLYDQLARESLVDYEDRIRAMVMQDYKRERKRILEDKIRDRWEDSADAVRASEPVYRAFFGLAGKEGARLSRDSLAAFYGEEQIAQLPKLRNRAVFAKPTKKDPTVDSKGRQLFTDIDAAAAVFGFDTGDEMIQALLELQKQGGLQRFHEVVRAHAERQVLATHPKLASDESIRDTVEEVLHGDRTVRLLEFEQEWAEKGAGIRGVNKRNVDAITDEVLDGMVVDDAVKSRRWLQAERRNSGLANSAKADIVRASRQKSGQRKAAAPALFEKVLRYKEAQLFAVFMFRKTSEFEKEVTRSRKKIDRLKAQMKIAYSQDIKELRKLAIAPDYIDQIAQVLHTFEFANVPKSRLRERVRYSEWKQQMIAAGREAELADAPPAIERELGRRNHRTLTVAEFRGLMEMLDNLEHLGRLKQELLVKGEQMRLEKAVAAMGETIGLRSLTRRETPDTIGSRTPGEKRRAFINAFGNQMLDAPTIVQEQIDAGRDQGVGYWTIIKPVEDALRAILPAVRDVFFRWRKLNGVYSDAERVQMKQKQTIRFADGKTVRMSKEDLIAFALNTGNQGNLDALEAMELFKDHPDRIDELKDLLDQRDWRYVQSIWNFLEEFRPGLAAAERALTGVEPEWIEAKPVQTKFGQFAGGYYPLKYDPLTGHGAMDMEPIMEGALMNRENAGRRGKAGTKRDMAMKRVGSGGKDVLFDLNVMYQHVNETLYHTHMGPAVASVSKVLGNKEFATAMTNAGRQAGLQELQKWLRDMANGELAALGTFGRLANMLRAHFSYSALAFSTTTAAIQFTGLAQGFTALGVNTRAGAQDALAGMVDYARSLAVRVGGERVIDFDGFDAVWAESEVMRQRREFMNRQVAEAARIQANWLSTRRVPGTDWTMPPALARAIVDYGYALMNKAQQVVDLILYFGARRQGLRKFNGDRARAIEYAEGLLQKSQGATLFSRQSGIERGSVGSLEAGEEQSALVKALLPMWSYMATKARMIYPKFMAVSHAEGALAKTRAVLDLMFTGGMIFTVEAVLTEMMRQALVGDDWWEEVDDEYEWGIGGALASLTFTNMLASVPFANYFALNNEGLRGGSSIATGAFNQSKLYLQLQQLEADPALFKATISAASTFAPIPASQINRSMGAYFEAAQGGDVAWYEYFFGRDRD